MTWYKLEMENEGNCRQFERSTNNSGIIELDHFTDIYIEVDLNTIKFGKSLDNTVFIGTNLEKETFKGFFDGTKDAATLTFTELQREHDDECYVAGANAVFKVEKVVEDVKLINKLETADKLETAAYWSKMKSAITAPLKWLRLAEAPPTFKVYVSKN